MFRLRRVIGSHRTFRWFLCAGVVLSLSLSSMAMAQPLTHGPILGAVTDDTIKVWARSDGTANNYQVAYAPSAGGSEIFLGTTLLAADDFTGTVNLTGLDPATEYNYRVLLNGAETFAGSFTTLPQTGVPGQIRFAYGADFNVGHQPFNVFDPIIALQPDFMIMGGDQVYADSSPDTKSGFEGFYKDNWSDVKMRAAQQQIPMLTMWDDHEITNNWSSGQTGRYVNARIVFDEYQGSTNPDPAVPGEIYYSYSAGEVDFFVLDTRSYRSSNGMADGPTKTMLGAIQKTALLNWLDNSQGKFKFIVSSVPFNQWSTTGSDSWYVGFNNERSQIFDHIRYEGIGGVVLISGDQHWSGAFKLDAAPPYSFYEFQPTPGGIGNRGEPTTTDPQVLYKNDDYKGFGMFTVDTSVEPATLHYEWIDQGGTLRYELLIDENDIISPPPSIPGDVNLDGVITTGSGDPVDDDVAAFIAGWKSVLPEDDTLTAWSKGDLNLDRISDIKDAILLNDALVDAGLPGFFASEVPEPTTLVLTLLALAGFLATGRRRS